MKSWLRPSTLVVLLLSAWAQAGQANDTRAILETLRAIVPVPPEWEGIWATEDSSYDCYEHTVYTVASWQDTICAGEELIPTPEAPYPEVCRGTATATTLHLECAWSVGDWLCTDSFTLTLDATRDGDSFYYVCVTEAESAGAACFGGGCTVEHVHGTRILPAHCATPTLPVKWGDVKAMYR